MARIRTVKPEFWTHEKTTACSRDARLLFIGLWNFADDSGRAHDSSRELKMRILPGDDDITSAHVEKWLVDLAAAGLIVRYVVDGKRFIQINGWHHQKIQHPSPSNFPSPPEPSQALMSPHESSLLKGREGKGLEDTPTKTSSSPVCGPASPSAPPPAPPPISPPKDPKGSRLPSDWTLPDDWRHWAVTEVLPSGAGVTACGEWADRVALRFRDHWLAKAGKDGVKRDWEAAWRNWVRKDIEDGKAPAAGYAPAEPESSLPPEKRFRDATLDERELARRVKRFCGKLVTDAQIAEWRALDQAKAA